MAFETVIKAGDIQKLIINGETYHVPDESGCTLTTSVGTTRVTENDQIPTNEGYVIKGKKAYAGIESLTIHVNSEQHKTLAYLNNTQAVFSVELTLANGNVYFGEEMSFNGGVKLGTQDMDVSLTIYGNWFALV